MSRDLKEVQRSHVDILGRTVPDGGSASAKALRQKCGLSDLGHAWETAVGCGVSKIHRDLFRVPKGLGLLFGEPCNATEVPVAEANMIWLLCWEWAEATVREEAATVSVIRLLKQSGQEITGAWTGVQWWCIAGLLESRWILHGTLRKRPGIKSNSLNGWF